VAALAVLWHPFAHSPALQLFTGPIFHVKANQLEPHAVLACHATALAIVQSHFQPELFVTFAILYATALAIAFLAVPVLIEWNCG
jgi:hypothetical protein